MRQPRLIVFGGAFGALALMSVLSAVMGVLLPTLLPRALTTLMAAALFVVFGVRMLREGMHMTGDEISEEWEEAKREVEREEATSIGGDHVELGSLEEGAGRANEHASSPRMNGRGSPPASPSAKRSSSPRGFFALDAATLKDGARNLCGLCFSPIFAHAFVLTFLGEWGDRSQIATIALAAAHVSATQSAYHDEAPVKRLLLMLFFRLAMSLGSPSEHCPRQYRDHCWACALHRSRRSGR